MRTDPPHADDSTLARLRSRAGRARRWLDGPNRPARWAAALGVPAAVLAAIAYLSSPGGEVISWEPLYGARKLSSGEAERVSAALSGAKIPYDVDARNRVVVPAGRKLEAKALLVKQKAAPRTFDDVRDEMGHAPSWIEGPADREARLHELREERLELMIRELPGIESAHLILSRPGSRSALGPTRAERTTAVVHLRPEDGVPLAHSVVESIQTLVISEEPDLRGALTIQDVDGHTYMKAGEPDVDARTHALALKEVWERQIRDRLKEIDGLRVFITLDAPPAPAEAAPAEPAVAINAPLGPASPPRPASAKAMVLAQVPIRYYRDRYHVLERPDHEPSPADLQPYVEKTDRVIQLAVRNAIPAAELGDVKVTPIDVPGPIRPVASSPVAELRRLPPWWPVAAVAAGCSAATSIGLIGRWLSTRRPTPRTDRPRRRVGYGPDSPGPSERVRDLVRRDPEAAARVLHRWIGAGEAGP